MGGSTGAAQRAARSPASRQSPVARNLRALGGNLGNFNRASRQGTFGAKHSRALRDEGTPRQTRASHRLARSVAQRTAAGA